MWGESFPFSRNVPWAALLPQWCCQGTETPGKATSQQFFLPAPARMTPPQTCDLPAGRARAEGHCSHMAPMHTPQPAPGRGRGHHPVNLTQRASRLCQTHTRAKQQIVSRQLLGQQHYFHTHTHRKVEAFGFKCSLKHLQSRNGSQQELRKTPSKRQEAWQVSVQSWLSSTWRKDLGWRREWAFSSLGSHVDTTNAVPEVLLQPKLSQATRPGPLPHVLIRSPERSNEQQTRSDSRASAGTAPGPGGARTCGTGPAAAGTRP